MIITRIWQAQPGKYFCLSTKDANSKWKDHFFSRSEFSRIPLFLKENRDKDLYFCPHGFSRRQRLKMYAVLPQLLWSDLDEADPRTIKIKPTIAIESSPGRFVGLWMIDCEMTEEMNRGLAYLCGGDKSGWDLTQVLRVPGTTNYKYTSTPRVKIMWSDGPEHRSADILKLLPKASTTDHGSEESDAAAIFKKYQKKMPPWCRRELISGKPSEGKRSEMIWKIESTLIEIGLSFEEAFTLVKSSPWNKFAGRRNEDDQLTRELEKVINSHLKSTGPVGESDSDEHVPLAFVSMDKVQPLEMNWSWYPYLARGELSILEGDPGLGKSYLAQKVAAMICDGEQLPSTRKNTVQGTVVYFDIENSAGTVTRKRLETNGLKNLQNFIQCEEPFTVNDEESWEEALEYLERTRPTLVVFDTINTYLGKADAYKSHEVQQAFRKFLEIARRFNCSVLVLRHLTKSTKERALYRGQGSIAFTGLARIVMTVGIHPEDQDMRVMAVTKLNVTKRPRALTFRIRALPDTIKEQDRSVFEFGEYVDLDADDILGMPDKPNNAERDGAKKFLEDVLGDGPMEFKKIERMAETRSISARTLQRAADDLSVKKELKGFGKDKKSIWSLPDADDEEEGA